MLFIGGFGFFVSLVIGVAAGWWGYKLALKSGRNELGWAIGSFLFPPAIVALYFLNTPHAGAAYERHAKALKTQSEWPEPPARADYKHVHQSTAIAVDREGEMLHLKSVFNGRPAEKSYPFADVRSWNTNIATGGQTQLYGNHGVSTALSVGVANYMMLRKNEAETGLFIEVRDIDFPEWRVAFPQTKQRELELKGWMEILRQVVNKN